MIENGYSCRSLIIEVKQNRGGYEDEYVRSRERLVAPHNHPEGIKGAQAIAAAVFLNRTQEGTLQERKRVIKSYIQQTFGYNLERTLDEIRPLYKFDVSYIISNAKLQYYLQITSFLI